MSKSTVFTDFELGDVFEAVHRAEIILTMRVGDSTALLLNGAGRGEVIEGDKLIGINFLLDREDVVQTILDSF